MRALQYTQFGQPPTVVEISVPEPRAGELLIKITAAGMCHSDDFLMRVPENEYIFGELPLTLGHEGAGVVVDVGAGVDGAWLGRSVLVYGSWGCGRCHACASGQENYCVNRIREGIFPPGLGSPGAMAEFMIVDDVRHVVPLFDLDPVRFVSLTDAALTPYHAIKPVLGRLGAGTTAVVLGVGGLGHVAIQILRALSAAEVIGVDVTHERAQMATDVGAQHALVSGGETAEEIRKITCGLGADVVFDFVGAQQTLELAAGVVGLAGEISIVGIGAGRLPVAYGAVPKGTVVRAPYWGSRSELLEVVELARRGQLEIAVETFSLGDAPLAYERMAAGNLRGRGVVIPAMD